MKCSKNCVGGTVGEASESGSLRVIGVSNGKRLFLTFISKVKDWLDYHLGIHCTFHFYELGSLSSVLL